MIHEEKKIGKIIEELTMFFFTIKADEIHSGISRDGNQVIIDFEANYDADYAYKLEGLEQYLNGEKNEGWKISIGNWPVPETREKQVSSYLWG